ncbi:MAG: hypothetical protein V5A31_12700 [Haloferacaceae archaeon]|jgi:hypothetical protein
MSLRDDATAREGRHELGHDGTTTVEAYEVDDGVVLHDAEEPFAWVEATVAVDLHEAT